jgi:hypothetical protein
VAEHYLSNKEFWIAAGERAIKTGAQAALASGALDVINLWDINLQQLIAITGLSMLASLLTSVASGSVSNGGPSLGPEELKGESNGNGQQAPGTGSNPDKGNTEEGK